MGSITVDEANFVSDVSRATGVDPRVLIAWIAAEGAYAPGGTGGHNYLNMRPFSSDVGVVGQSGGGFDQFKDERSAAISTVRRIQQPFIWQAPALGGPGLGQVVAQHGSPQEEISAIASSGWDAGHYGGPGGPKLAGIFSSIFGPSALGSPPQSSPGGIHSAGGPTSAAPGSIAGKTAGAVGGAVGAAEGAVKFLTSVRFFEVVGGGLLVLVGLAILGRQLLGIGVPLPPGLSSLASSAPEPRRSSSSSGYNPFEFQPGEAAHVESQPASRARNLSRPTRRVEPITDVSRPLRRRRAA